MAYLVFRHNLEICRAKHIAFTRPLDADDFPGSELFIDQTQAAATNTVILMSKLRPLWEGGGLNNSSGIEKIQFFNRESSRELCEFAIGKLFCLCRQYRRSSFCVLYHGGCCS
jgi:hypothetical protein